MFPPGGDLRARDVRLPGDHCDAGAVCHGGRLVHYTLGGQPVPHLQHHLQHAGLHAGGHKHSKWVNSRHIVIPD